MDGAVESGMLKTKSPAKKRLQSDNVTGGIVLVSAKTPRSR